MDADHPFIDLDGDGTSDSYEAYDLGDEGHEFVHTDAHGDVTAISYDYDGDGLIDAIDMDHGHTGHMTHHYEDVNGDGWMDTEERIDDTHEHGDAGEDHGQDPNQAMDQEADEGPDEGQQPDDGFPADTAPSVMDPMGIIGSRINFDDDLPDFLSEV